MNDWKQECDNPNHFISGKLHFDLKAMVFGSEQMIIIKKKAFPSAELKPVIINQDVVENIFCQVRSFNGQNAHPNYQLYMNTMNTVNFTETMVSKKANSGNSLCLPRGELPSAHPFKRAKDDKSDSTQTKDGPTADKSL